MALPMQSKLIVIKPIQSNLININEVLRTDIEASNRAISVLSSNGQLTIVAWVKKKVLVKRIEDVTDALWQKGGVSELIATCYSGALIRYTVHQDSGLTKTLQLSAQSLLSLITTKDSGIKSLKSLRIWGHTQNYILLQPQPDRLVLMSTNSGARPSIIGIIKTPNLQSAHIAGNRIIVQPCDGSYIYIHDATTCKTFEAIFLVAKKPGVSYIQWDSLTCSFSASRFAITDNERRLYLANFEEKKYQGKKNGIKTFNLTLRQLIWPAAFQPSILNRFILSVSDDLLSVFCSSYLGEIEQFYYFTHESSEGGSLTFQYKFLKEVSLFSGLSHELPDLFLTEEGLCMLTDKESQMPSTTKTKDFEKLHTSLKIALNEWDMEKVSDIKSIVEEDLGIFLSSCNLLEGWEDLVEVRSHQHAQLVDTLLTHFIETASESKQSSSSLLSLRELAKHHFKTLKDEVTNVLKYVDAERVSQQLLKLDEQMNFYLKSVEAMKLPDGTSEDQKLSEKSEIWKDRPIKEIIFEALSNHCVKIAETYFCMKPWIYGQIDSSFIISTCVDVAREVKEKNLLMNMEESYSEGIKLQLFASKDLKEILLLEEVLMFRGYLKEREIFAICVIKYVYHLSPHMIFKPPKLWADLICFEKPPNPDDKELTIGTVLKWSFKSMNLILLDIFARISDETILPHVEISYLWSYLLKRKEEVQLLRWINHQICCFEGIEILLSKMKISTTLRGKGAKEKSSKTKSPHEKKSPHVPPSVESLFGRQMYSSDTESIYSLDSSVWEGVDESVKDISESTEDSSNHVVNNWPTNCFTFISEDMVDEILTSSFDLQEKLLNVMAQYGIYVSEERNNPDKIIQRLIAVDSSLLYFKGLGEEYTYKINKMTLNDLILNSFVESNLKSPFYEYVYSNNLTLKNIKLTSEYEKPWMKLVNPFQKIEQSLAKEVIYNLCLETLRYFLSTKEDFSEDYISIFLVMLFAPNACLSDFLQYFEGTQDIVKKDVEELCSILRTHNLTPLKVVEKLAMEDFPYLQTLVREPLTMMNQIDISVYELLRGSVPFDIGTIFTWQKFNKFGYSEESTQPSFSDKMLSVKDGVKCSLDYYYYLKAGRPTYALASVLLSVYSHEESEQIQSKELPVYGLALSSWPDKRICSACVALLFIAQLNSETLRTILHAADLIIEMLEQHGIQTKVHENLMKSQLNFFTQEVKGILYRLCTASTRTEAAKQLVSLLEDTLIARLSERPLSIDNRTSHYYEEESKEASKIDFSSKEILHYIFTGLKLACELSNIYSLNPPQKILEFLAEENKWLLFLVAVQLFQYSSITILKMSSKFISQSVREHVKFCLDVKKRKCSEGEMFKENNTIDDYDELEEETENSRKDSVSSANQSWDEKGVLFKNKRKVRRKRGKSSLSISNNQSLIPVIGSTESSHSLKNKASSDLAKNPKEMTKQSVIEKWKLDESNYDVFSIVLWCHKREKPALELLEASVDLRSPVLAVIAACYDTNLRMNCLAAWLYSYIPPKIIKNIEARNFVYTDIHLPSKLEDIMSPDYFGKLVAFYFTLEHVDVVIEAFKIFDKGNLVLPLMESLKCTKNGSHINDISRILARIIDDSSEQQSDTNEPESEFFILTICQGIDLYLKNRLLQKQFIQALLPFSEMYPFKTNQMDWKILLKVLEVLGSISVQVKIFNFHPLSVEINLDLVGRNLIKFLIAINSCEKAFQIANVIGLKIEDIFCCQIESEFESMIKRSLLNLNSMKEFLSETHTRVTEKEVNAQKVASLFESLSKSVTLPNLSYLALQYAVIWIQMQFDVHEILREKAPKKLIEISDSLEFQMWSKYIEASLSENLDQERLSLVPPPILEKWPWEYGSNVQHLNYEAFINNSHIENKVHKQRQFKIYFKKYFQYIYNENTPEAAERKRKKKIKEMLQEMVKKDMLVTALRIEALFDVTTADVTLLKDLLKKVSEEDIKPVVTPSLLSWEILEKPDGRSLNKKIHSLSLKSFGFPSLNFIEEIGSKWLKDICIIINEFSEYYYFAKRLLMLCRIAEELSITYINLIRNKEPQHLLIDLLSLDSSESFQLSKELIEAYPISQYDVSSVLFLELLRFISGGPVPQSSERQTSYFFKWESLDHKWPELLSLTENPSSIGFYLMESYGNFSKNSHPDCIADVHVKCVETLIRAHDCFTQAANMEGINAVLSASLSMTKALLKHKQWTLMGRLLTGIKRYKEMSYIIDIMKEHQQFERLLGRTGEKSEKVQSTGLDKTLLHFLYYNYPEEKELLRMVASHFLMFSELAKMWEEEAERIMKNVLEASLYEKPTEESFSERYSKGIFFLKKSEEELPTTSVSSNPERAALTTQVHYLKNLNPSHLIEAIHCYCFASQYCIEEKQMMYALHHSRQAELIAVQLNLFKQSTNDLVIRVIKLTPLLLNLVMEQHLRVNELIIVARAYGMNPDWASSLYFHYIKNDDSKFLEEFLQFSTMTENIVLDVVKKIEKNGLELNHKERMGKILFHVADIDLTYKVASQLDMRAKVEQCLESKAACFLKDTVFSKGVAGSGRVG